MVNPIILFKVKVVLSKMYFKFNTKISLNVLKMNVHIKKIFFHSFDSVF